MTDGPRGPETSPYVPLSPLAHPFSCSNASSHVLCHALRLQTTIDQSCSNDHLPKTSSSLIYYTKLDYIIVLLPELLQNQP